MHGHTNLTFLHYYALLTGKWLLTFQRILLSLSVTVYQSAWRNIQKTWTFIKTTVIILNLASFRIISGFKALGETISRLYSLKALGVILGNEKKSSLPGESLEASRLVQSWNVMEERPETAVWRRQGELSVGALQRWKATSRPRTDSCRYSAPS